MQVSNSFACMWCDVWVSHPEMPSSLLGKPNLCWICSRLLFVTATAELMLNRLGNKCASKVQLMVPFNHQCQRVRVAVTNSNATADLRNGINTMTLVAVTESDSLSSPRQTSHLEVVPTSGSGLFRNVLLTALKVVSL